MLEILKHVVTENAKSRQQSTTYNRREVLRQNEATNSCQCQVYLHASIQTHMPLYIFSHIFRLCVNASTYALAH